MHSTYKEIKRTTEFPWSVDNLELDQAIGKGVKILKVWHIEKRNFLISYAPRMMDNSYVYLVGVTVSLSR
jgi:hypothetical protein